LQVTAINGFITTTVKLIKTVLLQSLDYPFVQISSPEMQSEEFEEFGHINLPCLRYKFPVHGDFIFYFQRFIFKKELMVRKTYFGVKNSRNNQLMTFCFPFSNQPHSQQPGSYSFVLLG